MLRVLYDDQIFSYQAYGGISKFYIELFRRYYSDIDICPILALGDTDNPVIGRMPVFQQGSCRWGPLRRKAVQMYDQHLHKNHGRELNRRASVKLLRGSDFDVFHPTYYDPYFLQHLGGKPYVLTVHDMIYEIFFPEEKKSIDWKRQAVEAADSIVTVSETTRRDVLRFYDLDPSQVEVIHLGAPSILTGEPIVSPHARYVLYIGNRTAYKNYSAFVEGLAPLLKRDPSLNVVCGGGPPFNQGELRDIEKLGIGRQVRHVMVTEESLPELYRNALAFVFPSLYEGFGLPALEAMANLCPAILSDRASLPEVGGSAALYFDPEDSDGMRSVVESVIYDQDCRADMVRRGRARAAEFPWDRTADEYKAIYRELA